jgi:hypothetical protein
LRALRANRVFGTNEKRIRTENTVMKNGLCLILSKIADCVRTGRRPRRLCAAVK